MKRFVQLAILVATLIAMAAERAAVTSAFGLTIQTDASGSHWARPAHPQ
jgi:hypothetical protein